MPRPTVLRWFALCLARAHPLMAHAVCVGNCRDNRPTVSIDEVQRCVNIFLGVQTLDMCTNCDRDGSLVVSIDEVQAAVNSFLGNAENCPKVVQTSTPSPSDSTATPTPTATDTAAAEATETATPLGPTETPTLAPPTQTPTLSLPTDTPTVVPPTDTPTLPPATATATPPLASATPTIPAATNTPTRTPTPSFVCGNGFLEPGETCTSCPGDCVVHACTPTTPLRTITVNFSAPAGETVTGVTVLVGYRSDKVSLPKTGSDAAVAARVKNKPSNSISAAFDLDYALREVLSRSGGLPPTTGPRIFTVDFDSCQGATAPTSAEFGCTISGCSNLFGSVDGCSCTVVGP